MASGHHRRRPARDQDAAELVERAKKDKLNCGSFELGSAPNLVMELFKSRTGMAMEHIPCKGVAQRYSVGGGTPADIGKRIRDSINLWGPVVKQAGIVVE
jgi:tripartite-type tricarboxylate transporter receptor subunit TctC